MTDFTKDVKEFTTEDLLDAIYGQIQAITEHGKPDNVVHHYFLPAIPFGPELGMFMDLGREPKKLEGAEESGERIYTVNDMARAAINFASIADYIPTLGSDPLIANEEDTTVNLNSLIESGRQISKIYKSVLDNCRVVNNSLSEADQERLEKLRAMLYEQPPTAAEPESAGGEINDELGDLLNDGSDDLDLDALLGADGADTADFVEDPDQLQPPTKLMKVYQALENLYYQTELVVLEKSEQISPNDPNGGRKIAALRRQLDGVRRRWETQGKKRQVEAIMAKIAVLSRGGMPQYLNELQTRYDANQVDASVFAAESGLSFLQEQAQYTALRPNGILRAPSLLRVQLESEKSKEFRKTTRSKTSGGLRSPISSLLANAGGSKSDERLERSFFTEGFGLSFEIVQGVIDRPWLDLAFLESPAYTMVDPDTDKPLDAVNEIITLSDGEIPPTAGVMPAIPMTVYFARDIVVRSKAFASMSEQQRSEFDARAGVSFLGFGASGKHTRSSTEAEWKRSGASAELLLKGQFLIGIASRFLKKAPSPDFGSNPAAADWV